MTRPRHVLRGAAMCAAFAALGCDDGAAAGVDPSLPTVTAQGAGGLPGVTSSASEVPMERAKGDRKAGVRPLENTGNAPLPSQDAGPPPEAAVFEQDCTSWPPGLVDGPAGSTCWRVNDPTQHELACFPNPGLAGGFEIEACARRPVCRLFEAREPRTGFCCVGQQPMPFADPTCIDPAGFTDLVVVTDFTALPDSDVDFWPNIIDNCPDVENLEQFDTDVDGIGDACDPDNEDELDAGAPRQDQ
jgi:hypothetical protein